MKRFILGFLSFALVSAQADVIRLGQSIMPSGEKSEKFSVRSVQAFAVSSTHGSTLRLMGCYEDKQRTGKTFPYRYSYTPKSKRVMIDAQASGQEISLSDLEMAENRVHEQLNLEIPWFCQQEESITVTFTITQGRKKYSSFVDLEKGLRGYYTKGPNGRVYIAEEEVDFITAPGSSTYY